MRIAVRPIVPSRASNPDLKSALKPYLIFLKFLGIVHCPNERWSNPWRDPWTLYCLLAVVYPWCMLILRWKTMNIPGETVNLVEYLIGLIAVLTEATSLTSLFIFALWQNGLGSIFVLWAQLRLRANIITRLESRVRNASWSIFGLFLLLSSVQLAGKFFK